jgi:hypothetical protein
MLQIPSSSIKKCKSFKVDYDTSSVAKAPFPSESVFSLDCFHFGYLRQRS